MNQLIWIITEHGLNEVAYRLFFVLAYVSIMILNLWNCKHYEIPKWKAILFTAVVYLVSFAWMFTMFRIETGSWGGNNIVRIFVWVPIIAWPVAKVMRLEWRKCLDFMAPCLCINHGVAHLGCIFAGCCYGYPCRFGIWNPVQETLTFPIQIIEALTALLIVAVLLKLRSANKMQGKLYPLMLVLFGYSRFLYEFARNNDKIIMSISNLALHALFAGIVGTVWLLCTREAPVHSMEAKT